MNYLKHCVYDAVAEWKARKKTSRLDPDTVKMIKDSYLRVKLKIEEHAIDAAQTLTELDFFKALIEGLVNGPRFQPLFDGDLRQIGFVALEANLSS